MISSPGEGGLILGEGDIDFREGEGSYILDRIGWVGIRGRGGGGRGG